MSAAVRINQAGIRQLQTESAAWLQTRILEPAARYARELVNVDTGDLRSSITTSVEMEGGAPVGYVSASKSYAIWQEFEPGEAIPGVGTRIRPGGRPFLRPGVLRALQPFM